MTVIEFALLSVWLGFGIRAGWMACDALIEAISAIVAAVDRRRFRRMLAEEETPARTGVLDGDFVRPRGVR